MPLAVSVLLSWLLAELSCSWVAACPPVYVAVGSKVVLVKPLMVPALPSMVIGLVVPTFTTAARS